MNRLLKKVPVLDRLWHGRFATPADGPARTAVSASLPGVGGQAFARIEIEIEEALGANGEELRLRAHLHTDFSALQALPGNAPRALQPWVRRGQSLATRLAASPLLAPLANARIDQWLSLRASTAPLDAGSRALLPKALSALGIEPDPQGAPLQSWFGETPAGAAQVMLLQINPRDLPRRLAAALGGRFHLVAAAATAVEQVPPRR